jgi:hypothetical protein
MKTTNYEISRQLAEAGFKGEHDFSWYKNKSGKKLLNYSRCGTVIFQNSKDRILDYYEYCFPAYDLETILEALPNLIRGNEELSIKRGLIGYYWFDYDHVASIISVEREENESLADTAARLLIKLVEQGILKYSD